MVGLSGEETSPSLLVRLRDARNQEAWKAFVTVYGPLIYGHARRRGLAHEDAEDVAQKVFARISAAIGSFEYDRQRGRFRDWLGSIVRHEVVRHWKKEGRQAHAAGDDALAHVAGDSIDPDWSAEYHSHVLATALARCQPHFEAETWRAFQQVWIDHCPPLQVSQEMNQPIDWIYVAKSRVLKRLWQEVQELAEDTLVLPHD